MKPRIALFMLACLLTGLGGALGSIMGHAIGPRGLIAGGIVGGLLGATASAVVAGWRGWIQPVQVRSTGIGACAGFLLAAFIATNTLSSPVGPILSTLVVGVGAILGARQHHSGVI